MTVTAMLVMAACLGLPEERPAEHGAAPPEERTAREASQLRGPTYVLGPDDEITIRALDVEEISDKPVRVDLGGYIRLPLVGTLKAAGLTVEQLEAALNERLGAYVLRPQVSVAVTEFRSQPVSVFGAVRNPGVYQLRGQKRLIEVLSMAGGVDPSAGSTVRIMRRLEWGPIPLPGARDDPSGEFSLAEVSLKSILEADNPVENITLRPNDVISVPRAEMVYVVGQVHRAGGFVLNERKTMTALQALSLAGGLDQFASPQNARILRRPDPGGPRTEIAVNLREILDGKAPDVPLVPEDILFVPNSAPKKAALRAVEAAIQLGTGIAIWRR